MTNSEEIKSLLGDCAEQLEQHLEPWQRGALILALTAFLLVSIYFLTKKEKPQVRELTDSERKKIEVLAEERILRRTEFLKRLRE